MSLGEKLFRYVEENALDTWKQILFVIRPHKIESIIAQFDKHLKNVDDLEIFNTHAQNIPKFLLEFCKTASRNFFVPGDPYGLLLTCRCTKIYTQDTLDKRHLKDEVSTLKGCPRDLEQKLRFEINIYSSLNQIYEISNKRKFTTIFVKNCTVSELLMMAYEDTCYLTSGMENAVNYRNDHVYINLNRFIIVDSFIPNILKIIIQKSEDKDFVFRHIEPRNIVAFTDLKYILKKCGIPCYFYNIQKIVKLQFFKNMNVSGRNYKDICNILFYQCRKGEVFPLNRTGVKNDRERSGLGKMSFEAVKQNYVSESIKRKRYPVQDSVSKMYFGIQPNEGTGYNFQIINKV